MPTANPSQPMFHCLRCGQGLTFHNARTERNHDGKDATVTVYFCIHHGFYHVSSTEPLRRGM